jgi:diguanylate cyclase (GGDEF)-like protein
MNNLQIQPILQSLKYDFHREHLKILVIDDDPVLVKLTCRHLSSEGYRVKTAVDGERGWKLIIEFQPDLIICDWAMPDISGVTLCERVKVNPDYPDLRVSYFILLTAHSEINYRVLGLDAGADEFLTKPINPYELRARVRAGLRISLMAKSLARANQRLLARNELLASLSLTDQLTGLLNRRAMDEGLPQLLQSLELENLDRSDHRRVEHICISLMMIDVDLFKVVNDTHGHLVGDEVLKAIAGRLQNSSRPDSLLYRYGGEEFLCITPDLELHQSLELAENIRQSIGDRPIKIDLKDICLILNVTVSVGVAIADTFNDQDAYTLIKNADNALYRAKNSGRNQTCFSSLEITPNPD